MTIPKHEARKKRAPKQQTGPQQSNTVVVTGPDSPPHLPSPAMQHDINHVAGLRDVAANLDWIGDAVARLTNDGHTMGLALCQNQYGEPIKLTLAENDNDDTMDRFVTALERIADSVAKLAGLNRPRLESWHEQDGYEPRYRASACDGGAPGPKTDAA